MSFELTGAKITDILEVAEGTSKAGKAWKKINFVCQTDDQYNNLFPMQIFQGEKNTKVDDFVRDFKVGDVISTTFDVSANEWQGKYYTNLAVYQISKVGSVEAGAAPISDAGALSPDDYGPSDDGDDLPF
jgi:hypothetical protein